MTTIFWAVHWFAVVEVLLQDCRVGNSASAGTCWSYQIGLDFWLVILKHITLFGLCGSFQFELALGGLISLAQLGVGSVHIWFFQLSWSILLGFCCVTSCWLWYLLQLACGFDGIWCHLLVRIKKMLEVSNKGPEWKYQFILSLYSRLSNFGLAINYLVTILFQEVRLWHLAACIFELANLSPMIGSKDRMYMSSECSKNVHTFMYELVILGFVGLLFFILLSMIALLTQNQILVCTYF